MKTALILLTFSLVALSVEPNYVKTTTYNVDGAGSDIQSSEYSDGLGRGIQTKLKLTATKDRTSCVFYDDAGRQKYVTKPFADISNYGIYRPGDLSIINAAGGPLQTQYNSMGTDKAYAFSSVEYYDDPLSRVKESGAPGASTQAGQNLAGTTRTWYFGVDITPVSPVPITVAATPSTYSIAFSGGFISTLNNAITSDMDNIKILILNALYEHFVNIGNPFATPSYFLTVTQNPDGNFSQELKDQFGKIKWTWSNGKANGETPVIASYDYDILGNVLDETPPSDANTLINSTFYTYNTLGQLKKKTTPDAGNIEYEYYDDGQIKTVTTKDPITNTVMRTLTYTYDDLGRLTVISNSGTPVIQNFYDDLNNAIAGGVTIPTSYYSTDQGNLRGRLVAGVASNIRNEITQKVADLFAYDDEGRIVRKYKQIPGMQPQEIFYTYDLQGKLATEKFYYNNQDRVTKVFHYDELGRLKNILHREMGDKKLVEYTYNDVGQMTSKDLSAIAGGYSQTYDYTIKDQLAKITSPVGKFGFNETIPGTGYSYAGNILNATYTYNDPGNSVPFALTYTYDKLNRLTTVAGPTEYTASYDYDPAGRITSKTEGSNAITGYQYYHNVGSAAYSNRLQKTSKNGVNQDYIYDVFGNLIVDLTKKMVIEYDWRNLPIAFRFYSNLSTILVKTVNTIGTSYDPQLAKTINGNASAIRTSQVVMLYDASGNRVAKLEGN